MNQPPVPYKTPWKEIIVVNLNYHGVPAQAIRLILNNKSKGPSNCEPEAQAEIVSKAKAYFAEQHWEWNAETLGRYFAQGQTSLEKLCKALEITEGQIRLVAKIVNLRDHQAINPEHPIYEAARLRVLDNQTAANASEEARQLWKGP